MIHLPARYRLCIFFFIDSSKHLSKQMADLSEVVSADEAHCFNVTVLEAVPSRFGQLSLIALYSSTSLFALLGNLTVIVVCLAGSESARTIRLNLINLALSDIILGVLCVPYTFTDFAFGQWIFAAWLCITSQYFQLLSVFVTSITLSIVGVERYGTWSCCRKLGIFNDSAWRKNSITFLLSKIKVNLKQKNRVLKFHQTLTHPRRSYLSFSGILSVSQCVTLHSTSRKSAIPIRIANYFTTIAVRRDRQKLINSSSSSLLLPNLMRILIHSTMW